MKKQFFFSMLAAAAMMASCSSDREVAENSILPNGEGYVSLAINLPTRIGATRAANDVYDDGTENEYAVYDATLILFEGTTETDAVLSTAYDLNLSWDKNTDPNITTTAKVVRKINDPLAAGNKFFALVVLNNNGQFVIDGSNHLTVNGVVQTGKKLIGTSVDPGFIDGTVITLSSSIHLLEGKELAANNFFMSNAPLVDKIGGGADPTGGNVSTLVPIDPSKIYESESLAASNPATEVCVERAVAKVTLSVSASTTLPAPASKAFTIVGWELNNTNTKSYLVRNVDGYSTWLPYYSSANPSNKYRFAGHDDVLSGTYRTYWGKDPNYTKGGGLNGQDMNYWTTEPSSWILAGTDSEGKLHPAYCAENTFDVDNQMDINTTAAILKVKFNGGSLFYTINNDAQTFYSETTLLDYVKAQFLGNIAIQNKLKTDYPGTWTLTASDLTVTYSTAATVAGITTVSEITVDKTKLGAGSDILASTYVVSGGVTALQLVNNPITIRRYVGGFAYYPILIKHFGDDLTPWRNGESVQPTASSIYPNGEPDYLGRYGVLRNNWYDIDVTNIKRIGTATVPNLGNSAKPDPDEPGDGGSDDDIDQYIAVKIHILSWAKRTQSVTL